MWDRVKRRQVHTIYVKTALAKSSQEDISDFFRYSGAEIIYV